MNERFESPWRFRRRVNPVEPFLRMDRMPHIWCPGLRHRHHRELLHARAARIQGRPGQGRAWSPASAAPAAWPATCSLDSFHTTHGRAIPFATGLKLANPEAAGGGLLRRRRPVRHRRQPLHPRRAPQHGSEGDLRQQPDLRHDRRPDRAHHARPRDHRDRSLRRLRAGLQPGAPGGSRRRRLRGALDHLPREATGPLHGARSSQKKGFCFIEVLSPCPTLYQRRNKMGDGLDTMKYYKEVSKIQQRRAHQRSAASPRRRDRGRQVRGSRPPRLSGADARADGRDAGRALRRNRRSEDAICS